MAADAISENLGPAVVVIAWVFAALAMAIVAARFYVRLGIVRKLFKDDYIILITLILAIGNSIFVTISASWGLGQHEDALKAEPERIMYTIKWVYLCEIFSIMSPGFGRISFAFLLLGLLPPGGHGGMRTKFLWGIISLQSVVDIGTLVVSMSQCRPIEGFWNKSIEAGCWDPHVQQYTGFFQGSVCSAVDLALALFPTSLFWHAKMAWKQKVTLSIIMGLGIFAMVASIIKTIRLQAISETDDATYAMAELALWWTLEAYFVLIAVSIPTLRPIFKLKTSLTSRGMGSHNHEARTFGPTSTRAVMGNSILTNNSNKTPFERLWAPTTLMNDISSSEEGRDGARAYRMGPMGQGRPVAAEHHNPNTYIRKDVTVSISLDRQSPDREWRYEEGSVV